MGELTLGQIGGLQAGAGFAAGIGQIAGAISASNAAQSAADRAIEASEANAVLLEGLGRTAKAEQSRLARSLISSQRVAFARNGVNVGTGSALDASLSAAVEGSVASLRAQFGYESQAYQERTRGILAAFGAESSASNILTTGLTTGLSTVLGGGVRGLGTSLGVQTDPLAAATGRREGRIVKVP